ncbi:HD-GYP domain-containing protein [Anaerotignum sp.]|uniref:HD-GYP domain-containing protein n=1 Tax=Anaerotignum sp. TaxID=2039241 RepID=UPI002897C612|nr:HD-GYP domain-containing protein [Anaerotignum sp.]
MKKKNSFYRNGIDYHEIIECITSALDAKDAYTAGHSQRVSDLSLEVCKILGLSSKEAEKIHIAAHLHDIGKVGVPDIVLNKEGKLTDEEWECMKRHPQIGAEILSKSHHLNELKDMVLYHHERVDGKGYPEGLFGNEIPFGAKIIAVCDSIDAMLSDRSYRKAHSYDFCYNEIEKNLGVMYDFEIGRMVLEQWHIVSHLYEKYRKKEQLKDIILLQRKN